MIVFVLLALVLILVNLCFMHRRQGQIERRLDRLIQLRERRNG